MKRTAFLLSGLLIGILVLSGCHNTTKKEDNSITVRQPVDTIGFAQYDWQMDSIMARIEREQGKILNDKLSYSNLDSLGWKVAISPHDDYSYVGYLYPAVLKNIKAKTIIIFGVAHKAKRFNLEDQIIFDSYDFWKEPYGNVKVSGIRDEIIKQLPKKIYQVNDSMQSVEHSVEDYAIVISTDAVHYGDEEWGGENYAFFGTGCKANENAKAHDYEIMKTISGNLLPEGVKKFTQETLDDNDFRKYKWTWCGRYSVPLGLLTAYNLNKQESEEPLYGMAIGYANSIDHSLIEVEDIGMGITAPAYDHHWVGYGAIGYK